MRSLLHFVVLRLAISIFSRSARADCDAEFVALKAGGNRSDLSSRIERWKALASQCSGTGQYELRLGALYTLANRDAEAREALTRALTLKTDYLRDIKLSLFDLDLRSGALQVAEKRALELVSEFPEWRGGHSALGKMRLVQGRFEESISELEEANAIEPASGTYTLLTMAYYKKNLYLESARSMQRALRLDRAALEHAQAVVAAAYSLVALGHVPEAQDLLEKHKSVQPRAADDPFYARAVETVREANASQSR
jgi:tetratricopeptide (TPR) repeat protein